MDMDEEKIFGPLTVRQFIYSAIGVGIIYLMYKNLPQNIAILAGILVAGVTFAVVRHVNPAPYVFNEEYVRAKKAKLGPEKFKRWIQMKTAIVSAQIAIRTQKGIAPDPDLIKVKEMLEKGSWE